MDKDSAAKRSVRRGEIFATLSAVCFGLMPLLTRIAYTGGSNAYMAAFGRFFYGALFAAVILRAGNQSLAVGRKELLLLYGLSFLYVLVPILLYNSYNYISSGLATTLHFTYPVVVMLLMTLLFHEKISARQAGCLLLCALGIALLYTPGGEVSFTGIILALVSGVAYSFYVVILGHSTLRRIPAYTVTFYLSVFNMVHLFVAALIAGKLTFSFTPAAHLSHLGLGLLATVIGFTFFQRGVFLCGEIRTSLLSTFEPLTSIIVGAAVLHEVLTGRSVAGCVLILLSCALLVMPIRMKGKKEAEAAQQPDSTGAGEEKPAEEEPADAGPEEKAETAAKTPEEPAPEDKEKEDGSTV